MELDMKPVTAEGTTKAATAIATLPPPPEQEAHKEKVIDDTRHEAPPGPSGESLDVVEVGFWGWLTRSMEGESRSAKAKRDMGEVNNDWLTKPVEMKDSLFFSHNLTAKYKNFTKGNQGLIYRGNRCMRTAPFILKTDDKDSNQAWAEFETHAFFGKNLSWLPWERVSTGITYVPVKKTEDYCDTLNGDGFMMKFDEVSRSQLPMHFKYSKEKMAEIESDNRFIAQNLLLKQRLQKLEKPHTNWVFILWIVVPLMIIAGIAGFFIMFPNAWTQLTSWFSGLSSSFMPPGAVTK